MNDTPKAQRVASAIVANYIHELSERHGDAPDEGAAEPQPSSG